MSTRTDTKMLSKAMQTYRKKPVTIQAIQWDATGPTWKDMEIFLGDHKLWAPGPIGSESFYINTLEGRRTVSKGDFVIRGVEGEFYPCKPGIFHKTYDAVEG